MNSKPRPRRHETRRAASQGIDATGIAHGRVGVELRQVGRAVVGDMPILIPGIGTQGGEVAATVKAGQDSRGWGMIINASRSIIFASRGSDFAAAARAATERLRAEINRNR